MQKPKPDPLRILVLIKGLGIGGAETLIAESARTWDTDNFEYHVVYLLPWKNHLVPRLEEAGVPVTCLDWRRPPGVRAAYRLRRLYSEWKPSIVHSHLPAAGIFARTTLPGARHVYTEHNLTSSYREPTRTLNRMTYGRNLGVIAVSDAVAEGVTGYPGPKPTVIPNGVSVRVDRDETQVREELGLSSTTRLIVHVGNIRPHKGHQNLIAATRQLVDLVPDFVVVSIGGEKREGDLDRMRRSARAAGVGETIRFLGRRSDARSFLAVADVVVNPADFEGLPVALLEALAMARPVVATAVGGVPSVVRHEESGLLVRPKEPEELALALERALTSSEATHWGETGALIVEERHGLAQMTSSYEHLYLDILDE